MISACPSYAWNVLYLFTFFWWMMPFLMYFLGLGQLGDFDDASSNQSCLSLREVEDLQLFSTVQF